MAYTVIYNPTLRLVKGSELTWQELDDNFTRAKLEFGLVKDGITLTEDRILVLEQAAGIVGTTPIQYLSQLLDVNPVTPISGNILKYDAGTSKWVPSASPILTGLSFVPGTGALTASSSAGSVTTNLDGRYVQKVNGVLPDITGNVTINLTATQTGTLAARPASASNGVIYVVSGDIAANNGKTFIYVTTSSSWFQVVSFDAATNSAIYAPIDSAALTGNVSLTTNSTSNALTINQTGSGKALVVNGMTNLASGLQLGGTTVTTTAAKLNFSSTVTSNIQTQLDNLSTSITQKANKASPTFTGGVTISDSGLSITAGPITVAGSAGAVGQVLTSQGAAASPVWQTLASIGGGGVTGINMRLFTASTTYVPTAGYTKAIAFVTNGGAGGQLGVGSGASGKGGTAGNTTMGIVDITASRTVTIGAGGGSSLLAGGTSSLSGYLSFATHVGSPTPQLEAATGISISGGLSFWGRGYGAGGNGYVGNGNTGNGAGSSGNSGAVVIWEFK